VKPFRLVCGSSLAGASLLLLVGCGSHAPSTHAEPASPLSTASPSTESTGLEPPQNPTKDAHSISLPSLPTGNAGPLGGSTGRHGCFDVSFLAHNSIPSGMVVMVTGVAVTGPFTVTSPAACAQSSSKPACAGLQLSANSPQECVFGVLWDGTGEDPVDQDVRGSVSLLGGLSCPEASTAECQRYATSLQNDVRANASAQFFFEPGSDTGSSTPPTTGSSTPPATGSSSPPTTSSSSPPTTGSSSPPTAGSSSPPATGSP
jgi:hypothetical protein